MAFKETKGNALVKQTPATNSFSAYVNGKIGQALITNSIQNQIEAQRFTTALISLVSDNPQLRNCEMNSIISAALKAQSLQLPLNNQLGFTYVVPYGSARNGVSTAQLQIGWKGFVQLATRSGEIERINACEVKEGELKEQNIFTGEITLEAINDPVKRANAKVIGYYAYFRTTNGYKNELYWSREKMEEHATRYSQAYKYDKEHPNPDRKPSFWTSDFDEMAKKTVLKQLLSKFAPMSVDSALTMAIKYDQAVATDKGDLAYLDNPNNTSDIIEGDIAPTKEIDLEPRKEESKVIPPTTTEKPLKVAKNDQIKEIKQPSEHIELGAPSLLADDDDMPF